MAATNTSKLAGAKKDVVTDTKEIAEDVKELVEDAVELVELRVSWIVRNPKRAAIAAGVGGVIVGGLVGAYVASRWLKPKYERKADEEIADVKASYATIIRKEDFSPGDLVRARERQDLAEKAAAEHRKLQVVLDEQGYTGNEDRAVETVVEEPITVTQAIIEATQPRERNVFESDHPDTYFDYEEEARRREAKPHEPFVITKEEFFASEADFEQAQLTYYDGDDVLCDDGNQTVPDIEGTIGHENLLRFGHGSGDPNIVYIRNNKLELDIEVAFSPGKYAKEVLGFDGDSELKHSDRRARRRRLSDE